MRGVDGILFAVAYTLILVAMMYGGTQISKVGVTDGNGNQATTMERVR